MKSSSKTRGYGGANKLMPQSPDFLEKAARSGVDQPALADHWFHFLVLRHQRQNDKQQQAWMITMGTFIIGV